ncbi:MAG: hypothetical protein COT88_01965 [Candidatus Colwellbacteria bacterium CG10_big_fil_rev_8_21_14_0_10_41_28]|uniref:Uncharacterized protein n=1 Tax=Candidatus Colwellbacteria bacterium CG10_big_fil_rev_8_21_14_0_10_41_28 TaxID=1974539 RepID=A0A2H0VJ65_9BACT|nr:MAG: hypothetical protein COT88_01965 [Candidatus Colwellbacteria bacterium CG10_big_fil_rev_8_21_14_0_10_41_28]
MAVLASLVLLTVLFIKSFTKSGRLFISDNRKTIYWLSVTTIFIYSFYIAYQQYDVWSFGSMGKYFLPPYTDISYFLFYSLTKTFAPYLISFVISLALLKGLPVLNRRYGNNLFEEEEYYLAALSIFLTGHPGWIFYFLILVVVYLLAHLYSLFKEKKQARVPLYRLWLIVAVISIFLGSYALSSTSLWLLLKI